MTLQQFESLMYFPLDMVTNTKYEGSGNGEVILKLYKGERFVAHGKKTLGKDDHSVIDQFGFPHYYIDCDLLYPDTE